MPNPADVAREFGDDIAQVFADAAPKPPKPKAETKNEEDR